MAGLGDSGFLVVLGFCCFFFFFFFFFCGFWV